MYQTLALVYFVLFLIHSTIAIATDHEIELYSSSFYSGSNGTITIDGQLIHAQGRGMGIVIMEANGEISTAEDYDTWDGLGPLSTVTSLLQSLEAGASSTARKLLMIVVGDTAFHSTNYDEEHAVVEEVLHSLGCDLTEIPFRHAFVFIGVVGGDFIDCEASTDIVDKTYSVTYPQMNPWPVSRYFVGPERMTWAEGEEYCERYGSNLASIHDSEEHSMASGICAHAPRDCSVGCSDGCSVGLFRDGYIGSDEIWKNTDGTDADYGFDTNGNPIANTSNTPWETSYPDAENSTVLMGFDYGFSTTYSTYPLYPMCNNHIVTVQACDAWDHGTVSNSMQIKFTGTESSSSFAYLNRYSTLPTDGNTATFGVPGSYIGDLSSVQITVSDVYGYCIKGLTVELALQKDANNTYFYNFDSANYFGTGIILSSKCAHSYQYLSADQAMIMCNEGSLELLSYQSRGIYQTDIHTCIGSDTGISTKNMRNMYAVITGKRPNENSYTSTAPIFLDHFVPGSINYHKLGHLTAANVMVDTESGINLYSLDMTGTLIGIKVEIVDSEFLAPDSIIDQNYLSASYFKVGTTQLDPITPQNNDDNFCHSFQYYCTFFGGNTQFTMTPDSELYVFIPSFNVKVNIYVIFDGYEEEYGIPFVVIDTSITTSVPRFVDESDEYAFLSTAVGADISWSDAQEICETFFDSSLVSIHSLTEGNLMLALLGRHLEGLIENPYAQTVYVDVAVGLFSDYNGVWKWSDRSNVDYTQWMNSGHSISIRPECAHMRLQNEAMPFWFNAEMFSTTSCSSSPFYACSTGDWAPDTERTFEINVPIYIDDIITLLIGNNNAGDDICVDSISMSGKSAVYISDHNIGGDTGTPYLTSVFKYPVCASEVLSVTVDYDSSTAVLSPGESSVSGLECANHNRLLSSECSISQSYELSKSTTFSIMSEGGSSYDYSWGSASTVSTGMTNSTSESVNTLDVTTTSDEFSWGLEEQITVGAEAEAGVLFAKASVSLEVSVGANQQWSETEENTRGTETDVGSGTEISEGTEEESNEETTESEYSGSGEESSWETSETVSIECIGALEVPPSHSVQYSLIFDSFNTTIMTYTDLKLTLCSAFLESSTTAADESHYIYIDNIPGIIRHQETTACHVDFTAAEYLRNDMTCIDEQKLAFSTGSNYIPNCLANNETFYDGCQCDVGDSLTLAQCFCVDPLGNMLPNTLVYVADGASHEQMCVEELSCANSQVTYVANMPNMPNMPNMVAPKPEEPLSPVLPRALMDPFQMYLIYKEMLGFFKIFVYGILLYLVFNAGLKLMEKLKCPWFYGGNNQYSKVEVFSDGTMEDNNV